MTNGLFSTDELNEENKDSEVKITEIKEEKKPEPKVKEVVPDQVYYEFTCKKCGGHDFTNMATNQSKWGGGGLEPNKIKVCRNCNMAENEFVQE